MMILRILLIPFLVVILLTVVMVIGSMGLAPETSDKRKMHSYTALEPSLSAGSIAGVLPEESVQMDGLEDPDLQIDIAFRMDQNKLNFEVGSGYIINI